MVPAIFGLSGTVLTAEERAFFRDADPAGYVLFARNAESREQLRALTDDLRSLVGRDRLLISVDQEGGRVSRLKPPQWPAYPAGAAFAALWAMAPASAIAAARANAEALAMDLAEVGINVDYWPCLDVPEAGADAVIGDRALGDEPLGVAALGRAILEGLAAGGVAGCVKHMPGHGRACADSHKTLPVVTASRDALQRDIAPFRSLCAVSPEISEAARPRIGMTAHIRYPAWDAAHPATLSPQIIGEVIRRDIGFAGLLVTDDLDMDALGGPVPERAERAIAAGCDVALNCWAKMADMADIARALPVMGEAAAVRLAAALELADPPRAPDPAKQASLIAARNALLALVGA